MTQSQDSRALDAHIALLETRVRDLTAELDRTREESEAALQHQILERRRAELQLQQNQKMRAIGTLAGGIAHDFNNILAAILGYTEMAMMDVEADGPVHRRLANVLKACDRARELVQQILTFSRQSETEIRPLAPLPVLKETVKLLRSGLPTTIVIEARLPSQLPMILADPANLHQVVMNLCTNAHQAMAASGGRLTLTAEVIALQETSESVAAELLPGRYLELTVADTGAGMPPEVLERVMDPYFTTHPKKDGGGLGLATVHGIVHRHGGSIHIDSAPGRGTSVTVRLPVAETEKQAVATPDGPVPGGRERILFVDDEQTLAYVGQQLLQRLGYAVTTCTSGVEALETLRAGADRFDLVITDQTMPELTGTQLARRILELHPGMPVILCTGFSETVSSAQAMADGIRGFLFKPIALRDLAEAIRRVLQTPAP
jgi:signal transduction histidine kinase